MQIYGKDNVFDVERLIDLLSAFESFREAAQSARGDMDAAEFAVPTASRPPASGGSPDLYSHECTVCRTAGSC